MERAAIEALLERAYEARRTEDLEGTIAVFHPEARFALAGSKEMTPIVGVSRGHKELRATLKELMANFQFVNREIISTLIENDRAVVHSRTTLRFVPKNKIVATELVDLWRFEVGKAVEFLEFVDTALVNDLLK